MFSVEGKPFLYVCVCMYRGYGRLSCFDSACVECVISVTALSSPKHVCLHVLCETEDEVMLYCAAEMLPGEMRLSCTSKQTHRIQI